MKENDLRNKYTVPIFQFSRTSAAHILVLISHFISYYFLLSINIEKYTDFDKSILL